MCPCFSLAKIRRLCPRLSIRLAGSQSLWLWNMESGQFVHVKESFLPTDSFANEPSLVIITGNMILIFRCLYTNVNIILNIIWIFCHLIPLSPARWPLMKTHSDLFFLSVRISVSRSTYLSFSCFQPAVEGLQCAVLKSARQPASHW